MHLSQKAADSMRMCTPVPGDPHRGLPRSNKRASFSVRAGEAVESVVEGTAEKDDCLLRLNDCNVCMENLERKPLGQEAILKAITASVMKPEKKLTTLNNEKRLLKKCNDEQMRTYCAQKTVVG